jgi:uncharacterized membrane protein (Fun14 family)
MLIQVKPNMGVFEDIFGYILHGTIAGLPTYLVMLFPLIVGLIVGFLARKFLKWAIIAAVVLLIVAYLGFFGLSLGTLKDLADQYGPMAIQYGTLLIGILPLGVGFFVGLIIGFLIGK